jgi:hypothetical protein
MKAAWTVRTNSRDMYKEMGTMSWKLCKESISEIRNMTGSIRENRVEERNQSINLGIIVGLVVVIKPRRAFRVHTMFKDGVDYRTNKSHDRHKTKIEESAETFSEGQWE